MSLRQLLYCIVWAYSLAAWLEINILLTYLQEEADCKEALWCNLFIVQQPSRHFPFNLAKIPPNQVIADFGRGCSVESESE